MEGSFIIIIIFCNGDVGMGMILPTSTTPIKSYFCLNIRVNEDKKYCPRVYKERVFALKKKRKKKTEMLSLEIEGLGVYSTLRTRRHLLFIFYIHINGYIYFKSPPSFSLAP